MQRFCLALDLVNDPALIAAYESYHQNVWPEIKKSITDAGITNMEIYRIENRLFMIIDATDEFSFEAKGKADAANAKVQEWEQFDVEIPAGIAFCKTRREVVIDG